MGATITRPPRRARTVPINVFARPLQALIHAFEAERSRQVLWVPVLIGVGIGLYFSLHFEPHPALAPSLMGVCILFALIARRREGLFIVSTVLFCVALGFAAAQWRTMAVAAPILSHEVGPTAVEGRVIEVFRRPDGALQLLLDRVQMRGVEPERTPERVRLVARARGDTVWPGAQVRLFAVLMPPPQPAVPGGFDFARQAWFDRLGGVGYTVSGARTTGTAAPSGVLDRLQIELALVRYSLTERIRNHIEPPYGAVAAALMTGDRGAMPAWVFEALRDSGLAHILSVSGLHMTLLAGLIFFTIRALLAAIEPVAVRYPIKKWAAAVALCGAFFYLLLSGASIPTQRAFVMTGLVLLAVMLDRPAISMRLIAVAATVLLLFSPESLMHAGFQMSFAAVVALIAAYETLRGRIHWRRPDRTLLQRLRL